MATHRNRYVKVILFEPSSTNLQGGIIVGQCGDWILIERPQPKARAKDADKKPRKPRTPKPSTITQQPGTKFDPPAVA
jgi:hypothetical protein